MTKKGILKPILLIGGAILIYSVIKASNFINGLKIDFSNLSLGGSLQNPVVYVTLTIDNPSLTSVTVDKLRGSLIYQGNKVSDVASVNAVVIDPNSKVFLDLQLQSNFNDAVTLVTKLLNKSLSNDFLFDGVITVGGFDLPYKSKLQW